MPLEHSRASFRGSYVNIAVHHLEGPAFLQLLPEEDHRVNFHCATWLWPSDDDHTFQETRVQTCIYQVLGWHLLLKLCCSKSCGFGGEGEIEGRKRQLLLFLPHCISAVWEGVSPQDSELIIKHGLSSEQAWWILCLREGKGAQLFLITEIFLLWPFWKCGVHFSVMWYSHKGHCPYPLNTNCGLRPCDVCMLDWQEHPSTLTILCFHKLGSRLKDL